MIVLFSCCGPVSRTTRVVRAPAGTGTWTVPPAADQCPLFSDTATWLCARTCRPLVPDGEVTLTVTELEAGDSVHARSSGTGAGPDRPRHPAITATSVRGTPRTMTRRNQNCRCVGRGRALYAPARTGAETLTRASIALFWRQIRTI